MKKKIISLAVVVLLAVSYLTVLAVADTGIETENGVITAELQSVMDSVSATAKIPVSIWTTEIDTAVVEEIALMKSGYNKDSIRALVDQGKIDTVTLEDVDKYIVAERRIYAQMQTQANQAFVNDYAFLKKASAAEGAYICSYAPMMIVELTKSQIETLAKDSDVNTMYYSPQEQYVKCMNISLPTIRANYTRDTGGLSGTNIRIGILDPSLPFLEHTSYSNRIVDTFPEGAEVDDHATAVSEIIASSDNIFKGVVPNASLYCAAAENLTDFYASVEWLLGKNVHVINMSGGFTDNTGVYDECDFWVDHIANNHSVHIVVAAGNESEDHIVGGVIHPGLAYNVITVGNLDDGNTIQWDDDEIDITSSYAEWPDGTDPYLAPNKPDIVAPGGLIFTDSFPDGQFEPGSYVSGTSFAAPHVTGVVAQLIQQMPALATLQDLMKAIITASISHPEHQYDSNHNNFDIYGAGVINAQDCTYTNSRGTFASSTIPASQNTSGNNSKTYYFTATTSDSTIRISLAWLKNTFFSSSITNHESNTPNIDREFPNLVLEVYAPDNMTTPILTTVTHHRYDTNNLAILQFDPAEEGYGTYKVVVKLVNQTDANTYFGLAWW